MSQDMERLAPQWCGELGVEYRPHTFINADGMNEAGVILTLNELRVVHACTDWA